MTCGGCGNSNAYAIRIRGDLELCNYCGDFRASAAPDVYFREPYLDPHLVRSVKEKDGVWVTSKRHKQQLMRELGVREGGDRKHGARNYERSVSVGDAAQKGLRR